MSLMPEVRKSFAAIGMMVGALAARTAMGAPPSGPDLPTVQSQAVATITRPVMLVSAPGDPTRKFVVDLRGTIHLIKNGTLQAAPFLDILPLMAPPFSERGLKCMTFHPNYQANGYFYLIYMNPELQTTVARFSRSATNPDVADISSRVVILTEPQPNLIHNGDWLAFGPDGYLYVALGENDVQAQAQDLNSLQGKLLRLDVNGGLPYAIPPGNPFVGRSGRDEIWAYGLRNPWRLSFDRATGDLWIGDVGEWIKEEINFQPAASRGGENYGWRCMEGDDCHWFADECQCGDPSFVPPVYVYSHTASNAVAGGYVYRGKAIPQLVGWYLFADIFSGRIASLNPATGQVRNILTNLPAAVFSFGEDIDGELYFMGPNTVRKIINDPDCDDNGVADAVEIAAGTATDCNRNGLPDFCDIALDNSLDENHNGVPDECENDCNLNGVDDAIDIARGFSHDCDGNSVPDECDIAEGALDCDGDGFPDLCQIAADPRLDVDKTGILDSCESSGDLNGDGLINTIDLGILLVSWTIPSSSAGCGGATPCTADINHDGHVNSLDLGILFIHWSL